MNMKRGFASDNNAGVHPRVMDALLLDYNGVIVDDERLHFASFRDILQEEGIALTQAEYDQAMATPLLFAKDNSESEDDCMKRVTKAIKNARSTNPLKR